MNAPQSFQRAAVTRQADAPGSGAEAKPKEGGKEISQALISVVEAAQHLCALLEAENLALREHKFEEVESLQERKTALSRLYEHGMKQISVGGSEALKSLSKPVRDQVMALAKRLDALVASNGRLLKASIEANQRVLKAVVDAARKHQAGGVAYDREGSIGSGRRKGMPSVAVSVNKTL
ncbi:MAG: flagellar export chaperone FlgN [Alphaproteobacteria bacterium]|nr:flagellar export chaperone FlgN [Alphaproteobacteria bacterium]